MSANIPQFSIVIPSLQEEKYILRTLTPFSQNLKKQYDFEIILSDGGSTDQTVSLAKTCVDKLIEHRHPFRQTIALGRNIGAKHAQGNILIFLNADTVVEDSHAFFRIISTVMKNPKIVAATCKVNIYSEEERFSDRIFHNFFNYYFWLLNVVGVGMGRGECQVVRKDMFFSVKGYNEGMAAGEDFDLFVKLRRHGKIAFIRSLVVRESPRRFRKFGYFRIVFQWFMNSVSVLFRGKSISDHWEPIR